MRWTVLVTAAITCLAFVVCVRSSPRGLPAGTHQSTGSSAPLRETSSQSTSVAEELCIGEIPDTTKELATVLQYLHSITIQAFEMSPKFGGNRGGFGGGQFGSGVEVNGSYGKAKEAKKPSRPASDHSPIPSQHNRENRSLFKGITSTKSYDPRWTWLNDMRGITGRGFVYKTDDRHVVGMPVQPTVKQFIDHVAFSDPSTELGKHERVWDVVELQLIGLFMHAQPVAYDKHLMVNESEQSPKTRELDEFETDSLKNLRAGAERVMAWNDKDNCLQVLGAIRAKESCQKCHEVKTGLLLGAFTYRIKEATSD